MKLGENFVVSALKASMSSTKFSRQHTEKTWRKSKESWPVEGGSEKKVWRRNKNLRAFRINLVGGYPGQKCRN